MKKNIRGNTVVFYWSSWKKNVIGQLSFFIGCHEKKRKGNNRNTHIHFNVMYILLIDDWLLCIVIASVVQCSALCLTHWRRWLNFCGKHNICNLKRNASMSIALSYITSDNIKIQISVGGGESCALTPWRPGFKSDWCHLLADSYLYFMQIIKSSITFVMTSSVVLLVHC